MYSYISANISESYFSNRQDSYVCINDMNLAEYLHSFTLLYSQCIEDQNEQHFSNALSELNSRFKPSIVDSSDGIYCVPVCSIFAGKIGVLKEFYFRLLRLDRLDSCILTPYFNIPEELAMCLSPMKDLVITSSETTDCAKNLENSSLISKIYRSTVNDFARTKDIPIFEYNKEGFSFHSKGLNASYGDCKLASFGSSNFNY